MRLRIQSAKNPEAMKEVTKYDLCRREIADLLKESGINPTTQRIEIAHLLLKEPQHLSADEILAALNKEYEQVSQATVYNTLKLFVERNVVRELIFAPDRIYYDSNNTHHHHFLDVESGKIYDVSPDCVKCPDLKFVDHLKAEVFEVSLLLKGRIPRDAATD